MANKAYTGDPGNPAFNKLTNDQIAMILNMATGDPNRPQVTADTIPEVYKKYPQMLANMNVGGTYVPNSPSGYGQQGISGGQVQGGMTASNLVNLVNSLVPPPQQQQTPQYQTPSLAPAQPTPTVQTTPLAATRPYGGIGATAPAQPAASAQQTSAFFNPQQQQLGVQPLQPGQYAPPQLPPLPGYQQPQRFAQGGVVQNADDQQGTNQQGTNQPITLQQSDPFKYTGIYDPSNLLSYLGALAGQGQNPNVGGEGWQGAMVVNPTPSGNTLPGAQGTEFGKSGVSPVGGPRYYTTGAGTVPPGPWMNVPSIFNKAPMPTIQGGGITPLVARTPANAAQMPQAGPMPTYAPQTSAPMPYGVNFGQVAQGAPPPAFIGAPPPGAPPPAAPLGNMPRSGLTPPDGLRIGHGAALNYAAPFVNPPSGVQQPAGTKKMQAGGYITGQPGPDQVPAMLTSGEYVMNRDAVRNIGVKNLNAMNRQRFQGGGEVMPREAKHGSISADSSSSPSVPATQDSGQTSSSGTSQNPFASSDTAGQSFMDIIARAQAAKTMQQNAALSAGMPAYPAATTPAAQSYAAAANAGQIGGAAPTAAQVQGAAAMSPAQTQSSIAGANAGAMGVGSAIAGGIGAIGQAFQQALNKTANTEWHYQPSAIPDPRQFQHNQSIQLRREQFI